MSSNRKNPSADDISLFRQAMRELHVQPRRLDENRVEPWRQPPPPVPRQTRADEQTVLKEALTFSPECIETEGGEALWFVREGVPWSLLRKLRRGHFSCGGILDLHGLNVAEAHEALTRFLRTSHERQIRCVRIIHGKGNGSRGRKPVLKGSVDRWLRLRGDILAFCSARPVDGGTGALYVLLRRSRHKDY